MRSSTVLPLGEERHVVHLRHYTVRLRHSQRLRYRMGRSLLMTLPVALFLLYALAR